MSSLGPTETRRPCRAISEFDGEAETFARTEFFLVSDPSQTWAAKRKPVPLASVGGFQPSRILNNLALQLAAQEFRDRPACRALSGAVNEVQGVLGEEAALLCEKRPQDNVRPAAGKTSRPSAPAVDGR